jgi:hypothetical protein
VVPPGGPHGRAVRRRFGQSFLRLDFNSPVALGRDVAAIKQERARAHAQPLGGGPAESGAQASPTPKTKKAAPSRAMIDCLFACRHCYRLAYASQQESAHQRGLGKSQKIRMRLGESPFEEFPDKPKGMHRRTYERWRRVHDVAEERSTVGLMGFVERLGRRSSRRA